MRICITGGTGFIGHYVVKNLLERGHELHLASRNTQKIPSLLKEPKVHIFDASLNDVEGQKRAMEGCDACIHIALGWGDSPREMLENDTLATVSLLEIAANAGCKKFIYTSSTAAMGKMRQRMGEADVNLPLDLYGATKAAGEAFVLGYRKSGMKRNIIRPGYTFGNPVYEGAKTEPDNRFKAIALAAKEGKDIHIIKNDGTQFIHASKLAKVYARVLESDLDEEIFLALGNTWISWKEIAEIAISLVPGSTSKIVEKDLLWSDSPMLFSVRKLYETLSLKFDCKDFIKEHLEYYMKGC